MLSFNRRQDIKNLRKIYSEPYILWIFTRINRSWITSIAQASQNSKTKNWQIKLHLRNSSKIEVNHSSHPFIHKIPSQSPLTHPHGIHSISSITMSHPEWSHGNAESTLMELILRRSKVFLKGRATPQRNPPAAPIFLPRSKPEANGEGILGTLWPSFKVHDVQVKGRRGTQSLQGRQGVVWRPSSARGRGWVGQTLRPCRLDVVAPRARQ